MVAPPSVHLPHLGLQASVGGEGRGEGEEDGTGKGQEPEIAAHWQSLQ